MERAESIFCSMKQSPRLKSSLGFWALFGTSEFRSQNEYYYCSLNVTSSHQVTYTFMAVAFELCFYEAVFSSLCVRFECTV